MLRVKTILCDESSSCWSVVLTGSDILDVGEFLEIEDKGFDFKVVGCKLSYNEDGIPKNEYTLISNISVIVPSEKVLDNLYYSEFKCKTRC